jgi:hypothetical protein
MDPLIHVQPGPRKFSRLTADQASSVGGSSTGGLPVGGGSLTGGLSSFGGSFFDGFSFCAIARVLVIDAPFGKFGPFPWVREEV